MNNNQPSSEVPNEKLYSILGCFWILFLIPLFAGKGSDLCKHYANYGLAITLVGFVLGTIFMILSIFMPLFALIYLAVLGLTLLCSILGAIKASKGEKIQLPLLSSIQLIK